MRKSSKFILVGGVLAALAVPSVASANVAVDSTGNGYIGKGDVQNVLKLKNDGALQDLWNAKLITFDASVTATYDNVLTCGANADNKVVHVPVTSSGGTPAIVADKSNNGRINGWFAKGAEPSSVSNDLNKVMQATFTACLPDKPYAEMTPEELRRLPVKVEVASTPTVAFGGLTVSGNGITDLLPNTPVV